MTRLLNICRCGRSIIWIVALFLDQERRKANKSGVVSKYGKASLCICEKQLSGHTVGESAERS